MVAAGFPALFEVAAETLGLTVACIVGSRFAIGCFRGTSSLNLSGLVASLLTAFLCLYGLAYWFHGIDGFDCAALGEITGACLSLSNALTFLHLFILSSFLHQPRDSYVHMSYQTNRFWKRCRQLGLLLTALHWGTLVGAQVMLKTAGQGEGDIYGARCGRHEDTGAFRFKWAAQLLNQLFQAVAVLIPLKRQLGITARLRFRPKNLKSSGRLDRILSLPVWHSIIAESISLVVTVAVASLAFTKAAGHLDGMPIFAVEVVDNAVNLTAIFYTIHAHPSSKSLPKYRQSQRAPPKRLSRAPVVSSSKRSFGYGPKNFTVNTRAVIGTARQHHRRGVSGSSSVGNGSGSGRFNGFDNDGRPYGADNGGRNREPRCSWSSLSTPSLPSSSFQNRRCIGPIKRLAPVLDMSPEIIRQPRRSKKSSDFLSAMGISSRSLENAIADVDTHDGVVAEADAAAAGRGRGRGGGKKERGLPSKKQPGHVGPLFFASRTVKAKSGAAGSIAKAASATGDSHSSAHCDRRNPAPFHEKNFDDAAGVAASLENAATNNTTMPTRIAPPGLGKKSSHIHPRPLSLLMAAGATTRGRKMTPVVKVGPPPGLSTPSFRAYERYKIEIHRATTTAAAREAQAADAVAAAAAAAGAEAAVSAQAPAVSFEAAKVLWPLPLVSSGSDGSSKRSNNDNNRMPMPSKPPAVNSRKKSDRKNLEMVEPGSPDGEGEEEDEATRAAGSFKRSAVVQGARLGWGRAKPVTLLTPTSEGESGSAPMVSCRSSSSLEATSAHAMSAFSVASLCSDSIGDEGSSSRNGGALAVTVKSPASYFNPNAKNVFFTIQR